MRMPEAVFHVDTGLIGDAHAGLNDRGAAEALRAFMDSAHKTDAMAGAAAVIEAVLPQTLTGKHVELQAVRAEREARTGKVDVRLQGPRIALLFPPASAGPLHRYV